MTRRCSRCCETSHIVTSCPYVLGDHLTLDKILYENEIQDLYIYLKQNFVPYVLSRYVKERYGFSSKSNEESIQLIITNNPFR